MAMEMNLYNAAKNGGNAIQAVEKWLADGVNPNLTIWDADFDQYLSPLYVAAVYGHHAVVVLLVNSGAAVHHPDHHLSALQFLLDFENVADKDKISAIASFLLWNGTSFETEGLLESAVQSENPDVVRQLVVWGADLEDDSNGQTPLQTALEKDELKSTIYLLAGGAKTDKLTLVDVMNASQDVVAALAFATKDKRWFHILQEIIETDSQDDEEILRLELEVLVDEAQIRMELAVKTLKLHKEAHKWVTWLTNIPKVVEACIGLQSLALSANEILAIVEYMIPTITPLPMFWKWDLITKIKHFRFKSEDEE